MTILARLPAAAGNLRSARVRDEVEPRRKRDVGGDDIGGVFLEITGGAAADFECPPGHALRRHGAEKSAIDSAQHRLALPLELVLGGTRIDGGYNALSLGHANSYHCNEQPAVAEARDLRLAIRSE